MGGSGLLLLGVVLLWAFGAVPHRVRAREQLANALAEEVPARSPLGELSDGSRGRVAPR